MNQALFLIFSVSFLALAGIAADGAPDLSKSTKTKVGDPAPLFTVTTLEGAKFSLKEQQGKVVLVNFFATWCGPCLQEMPHLESEVWQKHKDKKFAMIAIGREHTNDDLKPFQKKQKFTFPIAGDAKREAYSLYAESFIPRSVLIDANGRIVAQLVGYNEAEFGPFVKKLEAELAKLK